MGARPYDPSLGRFLEVDVIDGGSLNNYDYGDQDPVNGYDLTGLFDELGDALGGGIWGEPGAGEGDPTLGDDPPPEPDTPPKRPSSRQARRAWEKRTGQKVPKTDDGRNYHMHHKNPRGDGGSDDADNLEPVHPDEHMEIHKRNGDFKRWGGRAGSGKPLP